MGIELLAGGWIVYFALHSGLASTPAKRMVERVLPSAFRFYRLVYSVLATAGLIALMWLNGSIDAPYFFEPEGAPRFASFVFTVLGAIFIQLAFRQYRFLNFLGFGTEASGLRRHGVLGWVRHPIYTGLILIAAGFFLFVPNLPTLITSGSWLLYIPIGVWLEERKLVKEFGEAYVLYRKEVPALFPRWSQLVS